MTCSRCTPKSHHAQLAGAVHRGWIVRIVCARDAVCAWASSVRSREVFGCDPVECMGAVYSRADRKLSTRMQGECMGGEYVHVKTESYRHRYKLEVRRKKGR
jgi:hypothetical protein